MKNYVVCFDSNYDNRFIEVAANTEKEAINKAKKEYENNYGSYINCNIDAEEV
jgi:hypothetical protein